MQERIAHPGSESGERPSKPQGGLGVPHSEGPCGGPCLGHIAPRISASRRSFRPCPPPQQHGQWLLLPAFHQPSWERPRASRAVVHMDEAVNCGGPRVRPPHTAPRWPPPASEAPPVLTGLPQGSGRPPGRSCGRGHGTHRGPGGGGPPTPRPAAAVLKATRGQLQAREASAQSCPRASGGPGSQWLQPAGGGAHSGEAPGAPTALCPWACSPFVLEGARPRGAGQERVFSHVRGRHVGAVPATPGVTRPEARGTVGFHFQGRG